MIQVIIFLILTALMAIAFAGSCSCYADRIIAKVRDKTNPKQVMRLKKTALFFAVAMIAELRFCRLYAVHRIHPALKLKIVLRN